ncbi:MAG: outer membrane lipoprotein LolB [Gammaproteobacteria bacterium]|nr:outer membrane lipoprotein LolB [Gammaproteobacteria bacterium]
MAKKLKFSLLVLLLSACATIRAPDETTKPLWEAQRQQAAAIKTWRINGSIAIHSEEEHWSARMNWRQQEDFYQLRFHAPLGQGAMMLKGDADGVMLRTSEGETFRAATPDALLRETLNLSMPLHNLHFWIRGLPAPAPVPLLLEVDENGYLRKLQQAEWDMEYISYTKTHGIWLPRKLKLNHEEFSVKIVISAWQRVN